MREILVVSNIAFIIPICIGFKNKHYLESTFLFVSMIFSILYHNCDNIYHDKQQKETNPSVIDVIESIKHIRQCWDIKYNLLQFLDFYYARLCISLLSMKICIIPEYHKMAFYHYFYFTILLITLYNRYSLTLGSILVLNDICLPIICTFRTIISHFTEYRFVNYTLQQYISLYNYVLIVISFIVGVMFVVLSTDDTYIVYHSFWHVMMAISTFYILKNKDTTEVYSEMSN